MSTILITGASGFIGSRLVAALSPKSTVLAMSRKKPDVECTWIKGEFESFEDLRGLDAHKIDAVVHLAAVTGGCPEEAGLAVNVQGTRRLIRYLLDRGTRKFVLASSIAAVGTLDNRFLPVRLPMPDDHPCLAYDAYGLSKYLMEEETRYFARNVPDADFVVFRIGAVVPEDWSPSPVTVKSPPSWSPPTMFSYVNVRDVIDGIKAALASKKAGLRQLNLVGPTSATDDPVTAVLRASFDKRWGSYDLSHYERPGHEYDPLFSIENLEKELGFRPGVPTRPKQFLAWKEKQK